LLLRITLLPLARLGLGSWLDLYRFRRRILNLCLWHLSKLVRVPTISIGQVRRLCKKWRSTGCALGHSQRSLKRILDVMRRGLLAILSQKVWHRGLLLNLAHERWLILCAAQVVETLSWGLFVLAGGVGNAPLVTYGR